jgi:hypothetical protein
MKVTTSAPFYLLDKIATRGEELDCKIYITHEDFDYCDMKIEGDKANILKEEIENGTIRIIPQG